MGTPGQQTPFTEDIFIPYCVPCFIKVIAGDELQYVELMNARSWLIRVGSSIFVIFWAIVFYMFLQLMRNISTTNLGISIPSPTLIMNRWWISIPSPTLTVSRWWISIPSHMHICDEDMPEFNSSSTNSTSEVGNVT